MKKMKQGFTLAEVLVTLAIIGVVAALTLPNLLVNNQYKAVGTKLAKFTATTEQATRAYVASNNSFDSTKPDAIEDFINDTYLIDKADGTEGGHLTPLATAFGGNASTLLTHENNATVPHQADLKDGTRIAFKSCTTGNGNTAATDPACATTTVGHGNGIFGTRKVGEPAFIIYFDPNVGIPKAVQHNFEFVVTEMGFVYPSAQDTCLWEIYNNKFDTTSKMFRDDANTADRLYCGGSTRYTAAPAQQGDTEPDEDEDEDRD